VFFLISEATLTPTGRNEPRGSKSRDGMPIEPVVSKLYTDENISRFKKSIINVYVVFSNHEPVGKRCLTLTPLSPLPNQRMPKNRPAFDCDWQSRSSPSRFRLSQRTDNTEAYTISMIIFFDGGWQSQSSNHSCSIRLVLPRSRHEIAAATVRNRAVLRRLLAPSVECGFRS
jgi:hypothetical protein